MFTRTHCQLAEKYKCSYDDYRNGLRKILNKQVKLSIKVVVMS